ncbi:hypothetical protein [Bosea sp. BK604]|uniref:hypothetical protein n=1 Tax=Bosea sp. BK604 TaxID=2512180 RepID=UPI001053EB20|nr:hypothetical protein [Bosea sp. BK604]TCR64671.1 hypothetical protein EV560_106136 [Bosea sp. BK604]
MAKAPAAHPLTDLRVTLPDGRTGRVCKVYPAITTAPERAMVDVDGHKGALPLVPVKDLRVAS